MKIKLSKSQWEEMGKIAGWDNTFAESTGDYKIQDGEFYRMPKAEFNVDKKNKKKQQMGQSFEVTYPVSYRYNGGIIVDGKWYKGYDVPKPDVPEGYELIDIGVGLQLNAKPPYATKVLSPIKNEIL